MLFNTLFSFLFFFFLLPIPRIFLYFVSRHAVAICTKRYPAERDNGTNRFFSSPLSLIPRNIFFFFFFLFCLSLFLLFTLFHFLFLFASCTLIMWLYTFFYYFFCVRVAIFIFHLFFFFGLAPLFFTCGKTMDDIRELQNIIEGKGEKNLYYQVFN